MCYNLFGDVMKKELLSPVGSMKALYQAIHNGADAVYLGGKKFGARMFADNFTSEEMRQAIDYCHLYGVKIYATVNTIIYDDEVNSFLDYIEFLYINGIDAVIMQDIGMISLVKEKFPELEIHASTQVHNYNEEGIKLLKELGASRIVLARELSLDEIKNINVDIEKEVFIHGALCVCFSGCCLFSSMNSNRSGNRGECVASCRLPYELLQGNKVIKTEGNYLLSMKELNTSKHLKDILDSDVVSLKIEGRMKSPEYVGFITRFYRTLIDKYYNHEEMIIDSNEEDKLKKLFNREFTSGYLFNEYGKSVMNIKNQNHIGLEIGKVIEVNPKYIKVKLDHDLHQEDGIKFIDVDKGMIVNKLYNSKMLLTNEVKKGNVAIIDNKIGLKGLSRVAITIDKLLLKELNDYPEKKIGVSFKVKASINEALELTITDGINCITTYGDIIEKSVNRPVTKENIISQLSKLGNTPFKVSDISIIMDDNIFISLKLLNELRRELTEKLIIQRTLVSEKTINNIILPNSKTNKKDLKISVLVRNEEQLKVAIENKVDYIYVTDMNLFNKYSAHSNIYLRTERVSKDFVELSNKNILATELGAVNKYVKNNCVCSDYYLNINNNAGIALLENLGVKRVCISPEVKEPFNIKSNIDIEMIVYGRLELMITKYCPVNMFLNDDHNKCNLCLKKDNYYLRDQHGKTYPLIHSKHITHIMHYKNIELFNSIKDYKNKGINCFRLELFDEDAVNADNLIKELKGVLYE